MIENLLEEYKNKNIALYGLGTETERFIKQYSSHLSIIGLLDGFKESGEIYGYPIIPLFKVIDYNISHIIVIARPGSCKVIAKRIGNFCADHNIGLFDIRGRDLLECTVVTYDFSSLSGISKQKLIESLESSDVISFDLFDTLVMRKTVSYTDVFDLLDLKLRDQGVFIPDFARLRLYAEKEMSKTSSPMLEAIYERVLELVGGNFVTASELAGLEWELDCGLFTVRDEVRTVFKYAVSSGKHVVITTDSYYSRAQIEKILQEFRLVGFDNLFVSCEYNTAKTGALFEVVQRSYPGLSILHIGDDEYADIEKAKEYGIKAFRLYSAFDLLDALGGLGLESFDSLTDRVKKGLFLSRIFNSPFWFEKENQHLSVKDVSDIGYLFCAPIITDFIHWMKERTTKQSYNQLLFGARDGYLVGRLFRMVGEAQRSYYFLTSRTAAIRAGIYSKDDIAYVDSMKFSGSREEALKVRFGIKTDDADAVEIVPLILEKSRIQRESYKNYINKLDLKNGNLAFFDFVAKGTTQMYLRKLFNANMKGFYFLQLESEFMADKGLDIEPFYSNEEKNTSAIFENYYILETMLTSPHPQMLEMDKGGRPVFANETRSESDIQVLMRAQAGIEQYFKEYISIVPESIRTENKKIDEKMLELINKIQILDEDFLSIKVEDPFFGRMTDIKDVIG